MMHPKRWRIKEKLSQEQLAEKLRISQVHVSRLERGECRPSAEIALAYEQLSDGKVRLQDFPAMQKKAA
jgi:transcriptional regulator with XRE-family HTH domain